MSAHALCLSLIAALLLCVIFIILQSAIHMQSFLRKHTSLEDRSGLKALKRLVKINMYQAVTIFLLVMTISAIATASWFNGTLSTWEVLPLLIIFPLASVAGEKLKTIERKIKGLSVRDADLQAEFDHVTTAWSKQMFPDW